MKEITKEKLINIGLNIDPDIIMGTLPIGKQQLITIASALCGIKVIILDEPTSALTTKEIDVLFDTIRKLKKKRFLSYI